MVTATTSAFYVLYPTFFYIVYLNKKMWGALIVRILLEKILLLLMTMLFVTMMTLMIL